MQVLVLMAHVQMGNQMHQVKMRFHEAIRLTGNYGKLVKKIFFNEVQCNKCHKIAKGGIYKFKQYVDGIGDVKAYVMQTDEDRKIGNFCLGPKRRSGNEEG